MPGIVYTLWFIILALAVILLPFIGRLLHRTYLSARNIHHYLKEMKEAGAGIAAHTAHITALDKTIDVATGILEGAANINGNAETIKNTLAQRAAKFN